MKKLMMMTMTIVFFAVSSNASANEGVNDASSIVHDASSTSLEVSSRHAAKLDSRRERAGAPDLAVNENGEITNFGRVIDGEELYVLLGRPDLVLEIEERKSENELGNTLITVGVAGQVVSAVWMTAEFGNFLMSFAYPAGAGWGAKASLAAPTALGVTSLGVMTAGFLVRNQSVDPLTQDEKIQLVESQLGLPPAHTPEAQWTIRF